HITPIQGEGITTATFIKFEEIKVDRLRGSQAHPERTRFMKVVKIDDLRGTDQEVISPAGWTSVRFLLKKDGMGFSFHETTFPPGLEFDMWYKNHLEAVYCYQGKGVLTNRETGEQFVIEP